MHVVESTLNLSFQNPSHDQHHAHFAANGVHKWSQWSQLRFGAALHHTVVRNLLNLIHIRIFYLILRKKSSLDKMFFHFYKFQMHQLQDVGIVNTCSAQVSNHAWLARGLERYALNQYQVVQVVQLYQVVQSSQIEVILA